MGKLKYDKELLDYVEEKHSFGYHILRVLKFLAYTLALVLLYYLLFTLFFSSDEEKRMISESRLIEERYDELAAQTGLLESAVEELGQKDGNIYRELFNSDFPEFSLSDSASLDYMSDSVFSEAVIAHTARSISRLEDIYELSEKWLKNLDLESAFVSITSGVYNVVKEILNILIGFVASVYMLLSKDTFHAQLKKMAVAFFPEARCDRLLDVCRRTNKIFSGFIVGKLIDSLIIGVLCYFGMLILKLPYPVLIATIIGVTNIIPFFGPIFGLVPSALLILLINPWQCLYFVIFVLCLQQFDGNILGPHILGDSVGLSSFWILVSITVAGGIFGFSGMVLGVPNFAVFYSLFSDLVNRRLIQKGKTLKTMRYGKIKRVQDLNQLPKQPLHEQADCSTADQVLDPDDEIEILDEPDSDAPAWTQDLSADEDEYNFEGLD